MSGPEWAEDADCCFFVGLSQTSPYLLERIDYVTVASIFWLNKQLTSEGQRKGDPTRAFVVMGANLTAGSRGSSLG